MRGMSERRGRRGVRVAAAVVVAVLAAVAGAIAVPRLLAGEPSHPLRDTRVKVPPRVAVIGTAGNLGAMVKGFGDVWLDDRTDSRLLRVRSPDGRVLARVPVHGRLALAAGAGGIWALQSSGSPRSFGSYLPGPLLHVDPRTNRVRARIRLRADGDDLLGLGVYVHGRRVWVWGPRDVLRVDPRRDRVVQRIAVTALHGDIAGLAVRGRRLVAALADGTYLWMDARSGRPLWAVRTPLPDPVIRAQVGSRLVVSSDGVLAALEPATGRVLWTRRLGFRAGAVARAYGLLWVHSAAFHEPGDRLSGLDPVTGKVVTTSILPAFGMTGVVAIGRRLVAASAGGQLLVITPLML
jgi:hypothetical protein